MKLGVGWIHVTRQSPFASLNWGIYPRSGNPGTGSCSPSGSELTAWIWTEREFVFVLRGLRITTLYSIILYLYCIDTVFILYYNVIFIVYLYSLLSIFSLYWLYSLSSWLPSFYELSLYSIGSLFTLYIILLYIILYYYMYSLYLSVLQYVNCPVDLHTNIW